MREDPELVRDAGAAFANTEFYPDDEDNVVVTTHWKAEGLHRYSDKRWIRRQRIGKGGQGAVFLECLQDDDDTKRAVKRIDISDEDIKRAYYIRELEAVAKFSQEGVSFSTNLSTWRNADLVSSTEIGSSGPMAGMKQRGRSTYRWNIFPLVI